MTKEQLDNYQYMSEGGSQHSGKLRDALGGLVVEARRQAQQITELQGANTKLVFQRRDLEAQIREHKGVTWSDDNQTFYCNACTLCAGHIGIRDHGAADK